MTGLAGMSGMKPVSETGGFRATLFRAVGFEWIGHKNKKKSKGA